MAGGGDKHSDPSEADKLKQVYAGNSEWKLPRAQRPQWRNKVQEVLERVGQAEPRQIDENKVRAILHGALDVEAHVNEVPVVRPFLSSTFTDTQAERDLLILDVYQFLKGFARTIGAEFKQPAEMRWGIRKESTDTHQTSIICMKEIDACLEESAGLAYIVLLGDKYGYRPFPSEVPKDELDCLKDALRARAEAEGDNESAEVAALKLIDEWFRLDENVVPPVYVLQSSAPCSWDEWQKVFTKIQSALRSVCSVLDGDETHTLGLGGRAQYYRMSVTHNEVERGLFSLPEDSRAKQCFAFRRRIQGLPDKPDEATDHVHPLRSYVDLQGSALDTEAQELLHELRETSLPAQLSASQIKDFEVNWGPGVSASTHAEYLREFSDFVCDLVVRTLEKVACENNIERDEIYEEALVHIKFAKQRNEACMTTSAVSSSSEHLRNYLTQARAADAVSPFVVHGKSGSGKTSIMAKLVHDARDLLPDADIIIRFLGTTALTSNSQSLMRSLCLHIMRLSGEEAVELPTEYEALKKKFWSLCERPSGSQPLVIFLDSLDQLTDEDNGRELDWLPLTTTPGVWFVLSTLPDVGGCLDILRERSTSNMHEVVPMNNEESRTIVEAWLKKEQRNLIDAQKEMLLTAVESVGSPLYLKIAFEQTLRWRSYETPAPLAADVRGLVLDLFKRMEVVHGVPMTARAIGYMTVARRGLSDNEMEDILSCDDTVLDDVFEWWSPPVRRLPPLLWKRLRSDLSRYLVERGADGGTPVVCFYHRQFWEAAAACYLSSDSDREDRHEAIADYFSGRWASQKKPFHQTEAGEEAADRQVAPQPIVLHGKLGASVCVLNRRKLGEEVYNRLRTADFYAVENCLASLEFVWAMCFAGLTADMIEQYVHVQDLLSSAAKTDDPRAKALKDFATFVLAQAHLLKIYPARTIAEALNEPTYSAVHERAQSLFDTYRAEIGTFMRWVSRPQDATPEVLRVQNEEFYCSALAHSGDRFFAGGRSNGFFRVTTGRPMRRVTLPDRDLAIVWAEWSPDDTRVLAQGTNAWCLIDPESGKCVFTEQFDDSDAIFMTYLPSGEFVRATYASDIQLNVYNPDGSLKASGTFNGSGSRAISHYGSVVFLPGARWVVSGASESPMVLWDLNDLDHPRELKIFTRENPYMLAAHPTEQAVYVGTNGTRGNGTAFEGITFYELGEGMLPSMSFNREGSLLLAKFADDLQIFDTSTLDSPKVLGRYRSAGFGSAEFTADGSHVLAAWQSGVSVLSVKGISSQKAENNTFVGAFAWVANSHQLALVRVENFKCTLAVTKDATTHEDVVSVKVKDSPQNVSCSAQYAAFSDTAVVFAHPQGKWVTRKGNFSDFEGNVKCSPDGHWLVCGEGGKVVHVRWSEEGNLTMRKCFGTPQLSGSGHVWAADSRTLAFLSGGNTIEVHRVSTDPGKGGEGGSTPGAEALEVGNDVASSDEKPSCLGRFFGRLCPCSSADSFSDTMSYLGSESDSDSDADKEGCTRTSISFGSSMATSWSKVADLHWDVGEAIQRSRFSPDSKYFSAAPYRTQCVVYKIPDAPGGPRISPMHTVTIGNEYVKSMGWTPNMSTMLIAGTEQLFVYSFPALQPLASVGMDAIYVRNFLELSWDCRYMATWKRRHQVNVYEICNLPTNEGEAAAE